MHYDVIIIGAGLGGLTSGAKLAREGKKVLVIEQHSKPGGCATTFKRGDYTLEVGLHEMNGPSPSDMKTRVFNDLEVAANVEFIKVPEFYHFTNGRHSLTIPHDPERAREVLAIEFPGETAGIQAYFDQILNPKRKASIPGQEKERSIGEFLDSIIGDEDLKLVLLGNLGYFHDDPYSLSLAYYSAAQGSYYKGGGSFIRGGSQKLSDYLAGYIRNHGGEVLLNTLVTGLITDGRRLTGVSFRKKSGSSSAMTTASADEIIANMSVPGLKELLPEEDALRISDAIQGQRPGASLLTVYFGFRKSLKEIGSRYYSTFVFDNSVKSQSDIIRNNRSDFGQRSFAFVDYGQIDSGLAPEGRSVGAICCIDYPDDWEKLSREEYKRKKEETARIFISRLEKLIPGSSSQIEYYEIGTPLTVRRYTLNPEGAVYGFAQVPSRPAVNYAGLFDNLHFASAWGSLGGGFSGTILSGYLCAAGLLRKK